MQRLKKSQVYHYKRVPNTITTILAAHWLIYSISVSLNIIHWNALWFRTIVDL